MTNNHQWEGGIAICLALGLQTFAVPPIAIELELVADGLVSPVEVTHAGDGSGRLFVVDQAGQVRIVEGGVLEPTPFLDLTSRMVTLDPVFDERGLLGIAFHPDYETNRRFVVRYSAPRDGHPAEPCSGTSYGCHKEVLSEFAVSPDPHVADPTSEAVLFEVDEPEFNHNGGGVAFGPDGFLYFSLGDGGGEGDGLGDPGLPHGPLGHGQNVESCLGSVLRIDVDAQPDAGLAYKIPEGNPFVGGPGLDEIYAYGFRNPTRLSFDDGPGGDGSLYLGNVGQMFEEVARVEKGGNYGWAIREGKECFDPSDSTEPAVACPHVGPILGDLLLDPIHDYLHPRPCVSDEECALLGVMCDTTVGLCEESAGLSVIGGYVYRGLLNPALTGKYVFGNLSSSVSSGEGSLHYFSLTGPYALHRFQLLLRPHGQALGTYVRGMGEDEAGELYVCTSQQHGPAGESGAVYRITNALRSGACCLRGACMALVEPDCCAAGGTFLGEQVSCDGAGCPSDRLVSKWTMVVPPILALTVGAILLARRRVAPTFER